MKCETARPSGGPVAAEEIQCRMPDTCEVSPVDARAGLQQIAVVVQRRSENERPWDRRVPGSLSRPGEGGGLRRRPAPVSMPPTALRSVRMRVFANSTAHTGGMVSRFLFRPLARAWTQAAVGKGEGAAAVRAGDKTSHQSGAANRNPPARDVLTARTGKLEAPQPAFSSGKALAPCRGFSLFWGGLRRGRRK
jgi:hypothetical protein